MSKDKVMKEMISSYLEDLENSKAEIESELKPLVTKFEQVAKQIKLLTEWKALAEGKSPEAATQETAGDLTGLSQTKAGRQILYPHRHMSVGERFEEMVKRGYLFKTKRARSNLSASLSTSPHFKKDREGRYYLVDPDKEW